MGKVDGWVWVKGERKLCVGIRQGWNIRSNGEYEG